MDIVKKQYTYHNILNSLIKRKIKNACDAFNFKSIYSNFIR